MAFGCLIVEAYQAGVQVAFQADLEEDLNMPNTVIDYCSFNSNMKCRALFGVSVVTQKNAVCVSTLDAPTQLSH